jgi:uncharacterized membrane protein
MSKSKHQIENDRILYLLAYVFTIISGAIIYLFFSKDNKQLKLHSEQAIILGVIIIVVEAVLFLVPYIAGIIGLLIWLYGIYVGFEAYMGNNVKIPYITDFVRSNGL